MRNADTSLIEEAINSKWAKSGRVLRTTDADDKEFYWVDIPDLVMFMKEEAEWRNWGVVQFDATWPAKEMSWHFYCRQTGHLYQVWFSCRTNSWGVKL